MVLFCHFMTAMNTKVHIKCYDGLANKGRPNTSEGKKKKGGRKKKKKKKKDHSDDYCLYCLTLLCLIIGCQLAKVIPSGEKESTKFKCLFPFWTA